MLKMILKGWNNSSWRLAFQKQVQWQWLHVWESMGILFKKTKAKPNGPGLRSGGKGIPWGVAQGLAQGDWDLGNVSWAEVCNDIMWLYADASSSAEHSAPAQGGSTHSLQSWKLMFQCKWQDHREGLKVESVRGGKQKKEVSRGEESQRQAQVSGTMVVPPRHMKGTGGGSGERLTLWILDTLGLSV